MKKLQIPITKFEKSSNNQSPMNNGTGASLKFFWDLVVGVWRFFPRGLAIFLGAFSLLNLLGDLRTPGFDANLWWIDLRVLPATVARIVLLCGAVCLLAFGIRPPRSIWSRAVMSYFVGLLFIVALWNSFEFFSLLFRGIVRPLLPLPLSTLIAAGLAAILCS